MNGRIKREKEKKEAHTPIFFNYIRNDTTDTVQPTECRSYDNKYLLLNVVVNVSVAFGLCDVVFGHFTKNPICTMPGMNCEFLSISLPPCWCCYYCCCWSLAVCHTLYMAENVRADPKLKEN